MKSSDADKRVQMKNTKETLFSKGIQLFNNKQYYDAHEYWEELWLDYKLEYADFIQSLIQLSVSYFHYFNNNLKGAKSMINKSLLKIEKYDKLILNIDVQQLKEEMINYRESLDKLEKQSIDKIYCLIIKRSNEKKDNYL
tara:strand:+ start:1401 stop:1820 length:420 start_codon:yes stop_codon:yes gene_type:complete